MAESVGVQDSEGVSAFPRPKRKPDRCFGNPHLSSIGFLPVSFDGPRVRPQAISVQGYNSQAADKMETLWGIRHIMVHSAGIATRDFVRRHPNFAVEVGANIQISLRQVSEWIRLVYQFVDITDFYFAQRYESELRGSQGNADRKD